MKTSFIISTHSFIDVITNSSSELFICQTDEIAKTIKTILFKAFQKDKEELNFSGMGGDFEVKPYSEYYDGITDKKRLAVYLADDLSTYKNGKIDYLFPVDKAEEMLENEIIVIDIDWSMKNTIELIKENFNILNQQL
jgi:hypothetical protein